MTRSEQQPRVSGIGDVMPEGRLLDLNDEPVSLHAVRSCRAAVVVLYSGDWCPYCHHALRAYERDLVPLLWRRHAALFAISSAVPDGSLTLHELTYDVLSDPEQSIASALGIVAREDRQDCRTARGPYPATLPPPATVILDGAGVIRWIDVCADHSTRTPTAAILAALDAIAPPEVS